MSDVLGYELAAAVAILEREGFSVETEEARSRKGMPGNERRVIRQRVIDDEKRVCLTYAVFQTVIE